MKKWLALFLAVFSVLTWVGCSAKTSGQGDYPAMIMVEDTLYKSTGVEMSVEIDESAILGQADSYTSGEPARNGEINFDREMGNPYAKVEGGVAVLVDNEWVLFERIGGSTEVSNACAANDFELKLFADKKSYTTEDAIQIWATLEYVGEKDTVTIWHGIPYISFSLTDGADFNVDGMIFTVLTSTELNKGEVYHFDYAKSGRFSADDPDVEFWEKFYQEEDLKLPAGTYAVSVRGAFSLSEDVVNNDSELSCQLQIEVE